MKIKNIPFDELELMSYTDIAYEIIKENKSMNTPTVFKEICNLLGYSDAEYASKIGDFYTSLTTDKRFILLDNNEWDLRENHKVEIVIDDEDEETEIEEDEDEEVEEEENIDEEIEEDDLDVNDDLDDDIDDLTLLDEEEIEEDVD